MLTKWLERIGNKKYSSTDILNTITIVQNESMTHKYQQTSLEIIAQTST